MREYTPKFVNPTAHLEEFPLFVASRLLTREQTCYPSQVCEFMFESRDELHRRCNRGCEHQLFNRIHVVSGTNIGS